MRLIEAIEHTKWDILLLFTEFGFSPKRLLSEFTDEEVYHSYRTKRRGLSLAAGQYRKHVPAELPARTAQALIQGSAFPNDVTYLTAQEAADMAALSSLLVSTKKRRGEPLSEQEALWLWDESRRSACMGSDAVPRRCSMDDYLWAVYCDCRRHGIDLTLKACRHILQTKHHIAPLYSKAVVGSKGKGKGVCYLSCPEAPAIDGDGESDARAARIFDAVFGALRSRIETDSASSTGMSNGAL